MFWRSPSPTRHPPGFIEPCLPTLGHAVPSGPQWAYEIKHDGFRFICRRDGDRVRVFSRRGNDYTERVPRIVDTLTRLPAISVTLDGEGVACGPDGVTDFELLRAAVGRPSLREVCLYAFDLLELDGHALDQDQEPGRTGSDQADPQVAKATIANFEETHGSRAPPRQRAAEIALLKFKSCRD
jgi:bifunctional non-homologous end joining protein LigD